jgi:hypothetical protein
MATKKTVAKAAKKNKTKSKPAVKPKKVVKKPPKVEKKAAAKPLAPAPPKKPEIIVPPAPAIDPKDLIDCEHCDATGKCASGLPYDKSHHQGIFSNARLTSCIECLVAAGESHNSKKLVDCRFCHGTGKMEKPPTM